MSIERKRMSNRPKVLINHLGFVCDTKKEVLVEKCDLREFEIQDMGIVETESLDGAENWRTVYRGELKMTASSLGDYLKGDFSQLQKPGVYRIVLPEMTSHSWQFIITDGVFSRLPRLFLDFIHERRSGNFENEWRGASHLDDAVRSDTGAQIDASGGWYDAGDLRKWMTMTMLPVLGFIDIHERLGWHWNHFIEERVSDNDLLTETIWGCRFILKMQDPETGMIFEEIGGGGELRKKDGMNWWYENHSGCYADNSQNHFTDNDPGSGDERIVRTTYNPIVQYTNLTILMRAAKYILFYDTHLGERCQAAGLRCWEYVEGIREQDPLHNWTSVRAWRLNAGVEMLRQGLISESVFDSVDELLELQSESGYWFMDRRMKEPYRGILHSAQPIIALARFVEYLPTGKISGHCRNAISKCWEKFIKPMLASNQFGMMPYGAYAEARTTEDVYHDFENNLKYRNFMPDNTRQKINHGLAGHWTSWAHALALAGKVLDDAGITDAAWHQLYWLLGYNPLDVCMVSGVGYNNPMPHSRFYGTIPGGFMAGPRGDAADKMVVDQDGRAEWSSTEYWNVPIANALMALAILIPKEIPRANKI
jgi:hypothetical protein